MRLPRITILTPCRNGRRFICEAIESVQRQNYPNLEHIVLDACSTDGTLELLARYPIVDVISEPDTSAHDAMNKGIVCARGEVLGFLAVDDLYPDDTLIDIGRLFAARPEIDVVVGHSLVFEDDPCGRRHWLFARTHPRGDGLWLPELTFGVPGFFGCFFRRRVFDRVGNFDKSYPLTGDRHMLMRIVLADLKATRLDKPTICYRRHRESRTINRERTNLLPISREYLRMAWHLACQSRGRLEPRRVFLAWHAWEGAKLVLRTLLRGKIAESAKIFGALCRHDPLWPLHLADGAVLFQAVKKLDRRGGRLDETIA